MEKAGPPTTGQFDKELFVIGAVVLLIGAPGICLNLFTDFVNLDLVRGFSLSLRLLFVVPSWIFGIIGSVILTWQLLPFAIDSIIWTIVWVSKPVVFLTAPFLRFSYSRFKKWDAWIKRSDFALKIIVWSSTLMFVAGISSVIACFANADDSGINALWISFFLGGWLISFVSFGTAAYAIHALGWENKAKFIAAPIVWLVVGSGSIYIALFTDTTYYARAGMPGGGIEGERDAAGAFLIIGSIGIVAGLVGAAYVIRDIVRAK